MTSALFRNILLATDFSKGARRARDVAIEWALRAHGSLEVVHVVEPVSRALPGAGSWLTGDLAASLEQDLDEKLQQEVAELRRHVPDATGALVHGAAHREIVRRAAAISADLVILGAEGLSIVERPLLGSVTDRVLRAATLPVLVVPRVDHVVRALPRVIVAPSDLSASAKAVITRVEAIAAELGATLELVHALEEPSFAPPRRPTGDDHARAMRDALRAAHPFAGSDVHVHVAPGMPAHVIANVVRETGADLVAMASSGRGLLSAMLLGGVTDRVVRTSEVPVLVLRARTAGGA